MSIPVAQLASNFLAVAYSIARGDDTNVVFRLSMLRSVQMTTDEVAMAAGGHLVDLGYAYWGRDPDGEIGLRFTSLGFAQMRKLMAEEPPAVPPPSNVTHITNSTVGAVQQGNTGSTQSVQQSNVMTRLEVMGLHGFLAEARARLDQLDGSVRGEVEQRLDGIEAELQGDKPDRDRVRALLQALRTLGGNVALGAAGSGLWEAVDAALQLLT